MRRNTVDALLLRDGLMSSYERGFVNKLRRLTPSQLDELSSKKAQYLASLSLKYRPGWDLVKDHQVY